MSKTSLFLVTLVGIFSLLSNSCSKPATPTPVATIAVPVLGTSGIINISQTTASGGGSISNDGGASVTARGICWSTAQNPTVVDSKTSDGSGTGSFTSSLTGLTANTIYYVRAYATNSVGTAYGSQQSFTSASTGLPVLTTTVVSGIAIGVASSGGSITSDGGVSVTARGICWGISQNPTVADSKTSDGSGVGNYTSALTGLQDNTTYYARAYATNSIGTAYGNQVSFMSGALIPIVASIPISKTGTTASCAVVVSGGQALSACGICWSSSQNPTMADSKTISGRTSSGGYLTLDFSTLLQRLKPNTTYYVRAYASNSLGSSYSNQVTYTTGAGSGTVTDADGNVYVTEAIGTQVWMAENLKTTKFNDGTQLSYNPTLSAFTQNRTGAYCWYTNDEATYKNVYGGMYNWFAVKTSKLCPVGWHVPSDADWSTLTTYLGGEGVAGQKLIETGMQSWVSDYGTNISGFTATPGGYRSNLVDYGNIRISGYWWSNSEDTTNTFSAWFRQMYTVGNDVKRSSFSKEVGISVRCLKD